MALLLMAACTKPKEKEQTGNDTLPPVAGFVAYSTYQPKVFVPFGDIYNPAIDSLAPIRKDTKAYSLFLYKNDSYNVAYDSEQAAELPEDQSCLNDYLFRARDDMKGLLYTFDNDSSIMIKYLYDQNKTVTEDDWNYVNENNLEAYAAGLLVTKEWMRGRRLLDFENLSDFEHPEPADADIVAAVEKEIGRPIDSSHVEAIGDGWQLCAMQTASDGKDGVGVLALEYADSLYLYTETCEVDPESGEICWPMPDMDTFWAPELYVVIESDGELLLYGALIGDMRADYLLLRCSDRRITITDMGSFNMPL